MDRNDAILFTSKKIVKTEIKNRLVRSATYENAANEDGSITNDYLTIYDRLSKGNIGLIISGMIFIYESYNSWAIKDIIEVMHDKPLILVGGLRTYHNMEKLVAENGVDFVSISRPLIRQPDMIKRWSEGDIRPFTCVNRNNCFAGIALHEQLKCNRGRDF